MEIAFLIALLVIGSVNQPGHPLTHYISMPPRETSLSNKERDRICCAKAKKIQFEILYLNPELFLFEVSSFYLLKNQSPLKTQTNI